MKKNNKRLLTIIGTAGVLFLIVSIFVNNDVFLLNGHPTNSITVDEDDSINKYTIPIDATGVVEPELVALAEFNNYLQESSMKVVTRKAYAHGVGSNDTVQDFPNNWRVLDIEKTSNDNFFVVYGNMGSSKGYIYLAVFDKSGKLVSKMSNIAVAPNNFVTRLTGKIIDVSPDRSSFLLLSHVTLRKVTLKDKGGIKDGLIELDTPGNPEKALMEALRGHFLFATNLGNNSFSPMYISKIEPSAIGNEFPIAELELGDWVNGNKTTTVKNRKSLKVKLFKDVWPAEVGGQELIQVLNTVDQGSPLTKLIDEKIVGGFEYFDKSVTKSYKTLQIFSSNGPSRKLLFYEKYSDLFGKLTSNNTDLQVYPTLSDDTYVYFGVRYTNKTVLYKLNHKQLDESKNENEQSVTKEVVKEYPRGTILTVGEKIGNEHPVYGSTEELVGELAINYDVEASNYYYFQGMLNPVDFSVSGIRVVPVTSDVAVTKVLPVENDQQIIGGYTSKPEADFFDELTVAHGGGKITSSVALYMGVKLSDDYSPLLKFGAETTSINIKDPSLMEPSINAKYGWNKLDNWLITGEKEGSVTSNTGIAIYDRLDMLDERLGSTVGERKDYLFKRFNRNPNMTNNPIDWKALGFNKNQAGPQLISHFLTDSSEQTTVGSRWINKKTPETIIDQEAALDAQNFDIPLTDVQAGALDTSHKIRTKAKTMAWNMTTHKIDENAEDGVFDDSKLTFTNPAQVTALQQATEAKPYPIDIQYSGAKTVVNRVWVFVTDEQTTVDKANDVVIYAQDYRLALHLAKNETKPKVYQNSSIKVYQYTDISHETISPLEPIADKDKATQLNVKDDDLIKITQATSPSVIDTELSFTNPNNGNQLTKASIKVTLFHGVQAIRVKYEDENGKSLLTDVVLTGLPVGSPVDLTENQEVKDGIKAVLATEDYTVKTRPANETAIVVSSTETTVTYIFKGNVRFVSVTPKLTFETGYILPIQQQLQYKSTFTDFNVIVKDNRQYKDQLDDEDTGYRGDFRIDAQLTKPFTHVDHDRPLIGAQLQFNHTDITAAGEPIKQSNQDPTAKEKVDFTIKLDEQVGSDDGWKLVVPAGSAEKGQYTAEITWTLVEGP